MLHTLVDESMNVISRLGVSLGSTFPARRPVAQKGSFP